MKYIKSRLEGLLLLVLRRSLCKNAFLEYRKSIVIYMTLILLDDVKVDKFDCKKYKYNLYLNYDNGKPLFQTKWVTLRRYCIPSKKYLASDAQSVNLELCLDGFDNYVGLFDSIDKYIEDNHNIKNKMHHRFVFEKEADNNKYVKVKIYLETTRLFINDKITNIDTVYDLYDYLKEGASVQVVLTFSKMWNFGGKYGFAVVVERLRINEESLKGEIDNNDKFEFI